MLFSLSIIEGWSTASIDFKNAFVQATLPKPIFRDLPPGYVQANPGTKDKVMKIKKSLCGDCRAANLWCHVLRKSPIEDMGFTVGARFKGDCQSRGIQDSGYVNKYPGSSELDADVKDP